MKKQYAILILTLVFSLNCLIFGTGGNSCFAQTLGVTVSSVSNISCNGGSTGSATVTASGGTTPYTYLWSDANSQNTATATGLIAGAYTVTVTDAASNIATDSVTITQPAALGAAISSVNNVTCMGASNGSVTAAAVAAGSGGIIFLFESAVQNYTVPADVTTVTITIAGAQGGNTGGNGGGYGASFTGVCSVIPGHVLSVVVGQQGTNNTLMSAGGGGASWVYDSTEVGPRTGNPLVLPLAVAAGGGGAAWGCACQCTGPGAPGGIDLVGNTTTSSTGGNSAGGAGGNGGTAPDQFNSGGGGGGWLSDGGTNDLNTAVGGDDWADGFFGGTGGLSNGEGGYGGGAEGGWAGAGDCGGGGGGSGYNGGGGGIGAPAGGGGGGSYLNGTLIGTPDTNQTGNGFVSITGSNSSSSSGGTPPYTYLWSDANSQTTATATGLPAGTYTLTIQDSCGATATATAIINQPATLGANISSEANVTCIGGSNGSATVTASGGTSPFTYQWNDENNQTTANATGLLTGSYTVTIQDSCGQSASAVATINQPGVLGAIISTSTNVSCYGGNNGSATASTSGGTSPFTYLWNDANSQTTATATGLVQDAYTVTIQDSCGQSASTSVTITQPLSALAVSVSSQTNIVCYGANTGSASASASGGTSPYTYQWNDANNQTTATATGLIAGTYTLLVADNNVCTATASVTITQPATAVGVTISSVSNVLCNGGTGSITANTATGGASPYTYLWSPSGGTALTATGLLTGAYTITATDSNNCTAVASATITQPAAVVITKDSMAATSGNCNGSASVTLSGGTAPYTYSWNDANNQTTATATGLCVGSFCVQITDANGCTSNTCINVVTGIENISNSSNIHIYPDPDNGYFTVTGIAQGQIIELYNYIGQKISSIQADNSTMHFNISEQPNGIYLIRILSKDGVVATQMKIVKTQ